MTTVSTSEGRRVFRYELRKTSTGEKFTVTAYATATPGLIATEAIVGHGPMPGRFCVTHQESGLRIDQFPYGAPLEYVCLLAGALGGLPIDWTGDEAKVRADYGKLTDVKLRQWLKAK